MPSSGGKKKKYIEKRRWGLPGGHPDKDYAALNQEMIDDVVAELGNEASAQKAYVEGQIRFIVGFHQTNTELDKNPPRLANVEWNLNCVRESASELRTHIGALDYVSLCQLRQHGAFKHPGLIEPIAEGQRSGDEFAAICEGKNSRLLSMLDGIVEACDRALTELPADVGGSMKETILGLAANIELVAGCHRLFEKFLPGEATTTAGGAFRHFVSSVYELSTGRMDVDLERSVKAYARSIKSYNLPE